MLVARRTSPMRPRGFGFAGRAAHATMGETLIMIRSVTRYDAPSRCSARSPITFRWYGFPSCAEGDDVRTAVDVLFASIAGGDRVWNPFAEQMARSEFKRRIEKAERGELRPVDEVKPVDVSNPPPLYEIRWQGIHVTGRRSDGVQYFADAKVRLYHSEPTTVPTHFVGHHAHEKDLSAVDVNAAQQQEIRTALGWHYQGISSTWGIASSNAGI